MALRVVRGIAAGHQEGTDILCTRRSPGFTGGNHSLAQRPQRIGQTRELSRFADPFPAFNCDEPSCQTCHP